MPPKRAEPFQIIRDEEHFLQYFNENNKKLLVIDVHPTWSGPCEALYPLYRNFRDDGIVEFEKRVDIILVDQEKIANLKIDKLVATCRPKLVLCLEGKILHEVNGANIPELDENVRKFVPYI